ncbi:hypothetical protein VHEMI05681 [[Torrubiella] hemipterigena]|uniref:Uncharacterized protein n=1 Tax=[Torrubiella] hemipterigena TaxID=1531966 RepID=A0A0A1T4V7_9HYPO|nr:hypothetical protein VHEMI05681 [[Torrubiella] hemipterigena]
MWATLARESYTRESFDPPEFSPMLHSQGIFATSGLGFRDLQLRPDGQANGHLLSFIIIEKKNVSIFLSKSKMHAQATIVASLLALAPAILAADFGCIKPVNPIPAGPPGACCEELNQSHLLKFLYTGKNCMF